MVRGFVLIAIGVVCWIVGLSSNDTPNASICGTMFFVAGLVLIELSGIEGLLQTACGGLARISPDNSADSIAEKVGLLQASGELLVEREQRLARSKKRPDSPQ